MAFTELRDFHDPDLVLTIGGKEYRIPQPNASDGLRIRQVFAMQAIGDSTELEHIAKILGAQWQPDIQKITVIDPVTGEPVLDDKGEPVVEEQDLGTYTGGVWGEMDADGIGWEEIMHAGRTALIDVGLGRTVAEVHWAQGLVPASAEGNPLPQKPETVEGNRATRRAAKKSTPRKSATPKKRPAAD